MTLVILATVLPLAIYVWAGLSARSRSRNQADYFVASSAVSDDDYANTSVGYALQMAAVFLFASWGVMYGVGALWAAVFWGLGYGLLIWFLPYFSEYRKQHGDLTLHGFVRARFGAG